MKAETDMHYLEIVDIARIEIRPAGDRAAKTGFYEFALKDENGKDVVTLTVHGKPGVNPDILAYFPICEVE
jgi:hypothetical protein